jgi:hypothetical protein
MKTNKNLLTQYYCETVVSVALLNNEYNRSAIIEVMQRHANMELN